MKKVLLLLLIACAGITAKAQVYNNEWIDYSKTYYKFKVGRNGLYRISQSTLVAAGLGSAPAEHFQLWRNGVQVPIHTSAANGSLPANGFIEFWGEMNDGKADRELYRNPAHHINDKWSLETDTAAYFLTLNTNAAANLRLVNTANNVAGTTLPVESFFMHTAGIWYRNRINQGFAVNVGENLYSSTYDRGEGWTSGDIGKDVTLNATIPDAFIAPGGPAPRLVVGASGNAYNARRYRVSINADSIGGRSLDFMNLGVDTFQFNAATLASGIANISLTNVTGCNPSVGCPSSDRMVVHKFELTYPRLFNFGGATSFEFTLDASAAGSYLQITNFNYGSTAPVLYDLTNGLRLTADLSNAPQLRFVLPPSAGSRRLVLVNTEPSNALAVTTLQNKAFINYTASGPNTADYLILSHPYLMTGSNPVEEYRAYRASVAGGSYNAKIYLSDELIDQFGFGIKKHPAAIRNFIRYARNTYPVRPRFVFIIGHGVHYMHQRTFESAGAAEQQNLDRLNLVPTYGWPASDAMLAADPRSSQPLTPIGRLSAVSPQEVAVYLAKVKENELAHATPSPLISDKAWMKNVVHIVGASENGLSNLLLSLMRTYESTISDTLFGGKVYTFAKTTSNSVEQLSNADLTRLFQEGINIMTYFGHSSATTLEFNLDNPENYNNQGKYPLFIGLGCNAGNFFNYNPVRFSSRETISEKYMLAPNRGTIGFIASTHFGIVHYLNIWNTRAYQRIASSSYDKTIGEIMVETVADVFQSTTQEDFYARSNAEETALNGDPAIRLFPHAKPDYVIEPQLVRASPAFISVADNAFRIDAKIMNIGRAPRNPVIVEVKRQTPNGTTTFTWRDTIPGIRYMDSISVSIPINPTVDKGLNKITVVIDPDNQISELFESNNSVVKDVMIFEDEARPVYPYNFAIVNQQLGKLIASTANPFSPSKQYRMEIDTTELFNSPVLRSQTITSVGGVLEFTPSLTFADGRVYYWRVAPVPTNGPFAWNTASFVYMANSEPGFAQSHLYQHLKSAGQKLTIDSSSRRWDFGTTQGNLFVRNGVFPTAASFAADFSVAVNGDPFIRSVCGVSNIIINVFDQKTFKPWYNSDPGGSRFGSDVVCDWDRSYNFQFNILDTNKRRKALEFLDMIPPGDFVVVRNTSGTAPASNTYAPDWRADTTYLGGGNSIYHRLFQQGFSDIDSFNRPRSFVFIYKKNGQAVHQPRSVFSQGTFDKITISVDCTTKDSIGYLTSPTFGPAKAWKQFIWEGMSQDLTAGDHPTIHIVGVQRNGQADTLFRDISVGQSNFDISSIDAGRYPFVRAFMRNIDSIHFTPYQLRSWRFTYVPVPEGAVAPNQFFSMKDTVDVAEPLDFKMAFRNIGPATFPDSLKVKMVITDRNNSTQVLPAIKLRSLPVNDTLHIRYPVDTRRLVGNNTMFVEVNPDNDQPEQYHFNNVFFKNFYVRGDTLNPLLDVTFDNVRILNYDIVSAKPSIVIKLKDESKWFLQDDPSKMRVQLRRLPSDTDPNGWLRTFNFDGDTLQFVPAQNAPNAANTASAIFKPQLADGKYELIVYGQDMSDNRAGRMEYRVIFEVIGKPMISNMLNYPNPFTTSTAFVFTITGSEVPQNIRIQILTVTGKVVREITKEELGPLHIGRNITEFKWDGTDQYGQKLANGVYLYRVITNLNGKSLDKYKSENDNTDKYFNKGYGKMYLMR